MLPSESPCDPEAGRSPLLTSWYFFQKPNLCKLYFMLAKISHSTELQKAIQMAVWATLKLHLLASVHWAPNLWETLCHHISFVPSGNRIIRQAQADPKSGLQSHAGGKKDNLLLWALDCYTGKHSLSIKNDSSWPSSTFTHPLPCQPLIKYQQLMKAQYFSKSPLLFTSRVSSFLVHPMIMPYLQGHVQTFPFSDSICKNN